MGKSTISMGRFEQQTVSHCQRVRYSPQIIHFQQISRIITYYNPSQPLIIIFPRKTGVEMPHFTPRMSAWTMCDNYKLEGIPCTKADHVGVRLGFNVIQLVTIPIQCIPTSADRLLEPENSNIQWKRSCLFIPICEESIFITKKHCYSHAAKLLDVQCLCLKSLARL